jgi:hypothetical protein
MPRRFSKGQLREHVAGSLRGVRQLGAGLESSSLHPNCGVAS